MSTSSMLLSVAGWGVSSLPDLPKHDWTHHDHEPRGWYMSPDGDEHLHTGSDVQETSNAVLYSSLRDTRASTQVGRERATDHGEVRALVGRLAQRCEHLEREYTSLRQEVQALRDQRMRDRSLEVAITSGASAVAAPRPNPLRSYSAWQREHGKDHLWQWVAVRDGELLAFNPNLKQLHQDLFGLNIPLDDVMVTRVIPG